MRKKLISVVIPLFNEEKNILLIYKELKDVFVSLKDHYNYEFIFIDDGSTDGTFSLLEVLSHDDPNVKFLQFSRNFGKEVALSAGLKNVLGEAVLNIDADLQHPPKYIPQFLKSWEEGAEIVVGMRENYNSGSLLRKFFSYFFYKLQNNISDIKIDPNETDFRLLDRKVVNEFGRFTERGRITRGLIDWLGFKKSYVKFTVGKRSESASTYNMIKLTKLAISTFIAHSLLPLKLAGYFGLLITFFSGCLGVFIFIEKYLFNDILNLNITGTASLAVLIIFMVGINLCCLGLISLYIANIHNEVSNRPLYVIRKRGNMGNASN